MNSHRPEDSASCRLGRLCQNPQCMLCFPQLVLTAPTTTTSFSSNKPKRKEPAWHHATTTEATLSHTSRAKQDDDLVELLVVQCTARGDKFHPLRTIWCRRTATLHELRRHVLPLEITVLQPPTKFYFVRVVAGHVVRITPAQEDGPKAYRAQAFCPPLAPSPRLLVCLEGSSFSSSSSSLVSKTNTALPLSLVARKTIGGGSGRHTKKQVGEKAAVKDNAQLFLPDASKESSRTIDESLECQVQLEIEESATSAINDNDDKTIDLGIIHVASRSVSLGTVRRAIATQLTAPPRGDYRLVRPLRTPHQQQLEGKPASPRTVVLSKSQEEQGHLCLHHILMQQASPASNNKNTTTPRIILQTRKSYTQGQVIADETKTRELKSLARALQQQQEQPGDKKKKHKSSSSAGGRSPRDMVKAKAAEYINAFLNSAGGVLILGANDDGVIERVPIYGNANFAVVGDDDLDARVALARQVKDDIRKLVDGMCLHMDPSVDDDLVTTTFVPVLPANNSQPMDEREEEVYNVIEIHVKPGRRSLYFVDKHGFEAYERRDGSTHCMDQSSIRAALQRQKCVEDADWKGGWRQLSSPFNFGPLMRRISDPWAGREWLFAAVRQSLFRSVTTQEISESSSSSSWGVALVGARGIGKSSFLAELTLRPKSVTQVEVVAHHMCRPDDPDSLSPALFVQSMAAMLTKNCRAYRLLMINMPSSSSSVHGGDTIGAGMLRALRREQCESNPDDAFLRGILRPLQEIENRKQAGQTEGCKLPLVVVVDALDDALGVDIESLTVRRGSSTIAHLLERGLGSIGLPPWIRFVVSFRRDMCHVSGPIQRLAHRLNSIYLDLKPSEDVWIRQAQEDIRLFAGAFIERHKMESPLGRHVGRGKWDPTTAARDTANLRLEKGEKTQLWEHEEETETWVAFDEFATIDLNYCKSAGLGKCFISMGNKTSLVDFTAGTMLDVKSKKSVRIRHMDIATDEKEATTFIPKDSRYQEDQEKLQSVVCARCNGVGHFARHCPQVIEEVKEREKLRKSENEILEKLALNAQGNYLYTRTVLEDIRSGAMQWKDVPSLPSGLDHLYHRFFVRTLVAAFHLIQGVKARKPTSHQDLEPSNQFWRFCWLPQNVVSRSKKLHKLL